MLTKTNFKDVEVEPSGVQEDMVTKWMKKVRVISNTKNEKNNNNIYICKYIYVKEKKANIKK